MPDSAQSARKHRSRGFQEQNIQAPESQNQLNLGGRQLTTKIVPVIISGGSGRRLWPLSRQSKPKQFLKFNSQYSLIQQTALRCSASIFAKPIIVCARSHRFLIGEALEEIGVQADILLEPVARNSCAAITAGCLKALQDAPGAMVLVLACDHHIPDQEKFVETVFTAFNGADAGYVVTFGVVPTHATAAYGYIQPGEPIDRDGAMLVRQFVEKPDHQQSQNFIDEGYLWNSGNFLFRAQTFIEELKKYQPRVFANVAHSFANSVKDLDFLRLEQKSFESAPSISVDYGLMARTQKALVYRVDYEWQDIGCWFSVWQMTEKNRSGNAIIGKGHVVEGHNNLVHSEGNLTTLVGLDNIAVISTRDAVLVTSLSDAHNVKQLVGDLQHSGYPQAREALPLLQPWGNHERLDEGARYLVKRIVIKPGGILSLQKHKHRAQHWIGVQGRPQITIDGKVTRLQPNQSVYVPTGSTHRLANNGAETVILIEVQTGDNLEEDDSYNSTVLKD